MKNAGFMQRNLFLLILCTVAGIFVSSCGLEEIFTVEEPTVVLNAPLYSSSDSLTWYFSFKPSDDNGKAFIGTDVYYKIYNDSSKLSSDRSSILSVNTSSNSTEAAKRMIESYGYQPLGTSIATGYAVFVPKNLEDSENNEEDSENNKKLNSIVFRLKTSLSYAGDSDSASADDRYKSHACIGVKENTKYLYKDYIPFRNGNRKSFDFFDSDENDKNRTRDALPVYGDSDYSCNESDKDKSFDEYYVQAFAVGVAFNDQTTALSYSLVLDLGSVPIKKDE